MDDVVVYNELVAVSAGAGLLGFAWFLARLIRGRRIDSEGWAAFFGVTGLLLLVLGLHTTVTWPFGGNGFEYANVAFGQPAAGFGALLLFAAVYLWRHRALFAGEPDEANATALAALKPISVFVGSLGLAMGVLAITFVRFQLGAAPARSPSAAASATCPSWRRSSSAACGAWSRSARCSSHRAAAEPAVVAAVGRRAWVVGGAVFLLFGAMNYYTHIGMYFNIAHGTMHLW